MRFVPVLLAAVLALSGTMTAAPAHAADSRSLRSDGTVTIKGHGYGHGHGMSQYGAEGAARQGLTHRQIVEFYYPGTTWGTAKGRVTVLITADTTDDLVVRPAPGLTVRDTAGGERVRLPDVGARQWRVAAGADGVNRVSYQTGSPLAGLAHARGAGRVRRGRTADRASSRRRASAPTAASCASACVGGDRVTVNDLGARQLPPGRRAAARSRRCGAPRRCGRRRWPPAPTPPSSARHPKTSAYQICDTGSCQVYGGYDAEHPASNAAIEATRRQVLRSGGEPAFTQFGSSSGGWTSAGSMPYLPAQRDPYDGWSGNPVHTWQTSIADASHRAGLAGRRRPAPDRRQPPRRQRRVGRAGRRR